jgi:hypothetical protein
MASQDNLVSKLAALVAGFDDPAWEALSSKGLLRRARKDMEKGVAVEVLEETAAGLEMNVPPFHVSIPPSGPAKATCTCPAPGICQHILTAGLYLQTQFLAPLEKQSGATADSIREEIGFITPERMKARVGAADYRAGASLLERNSLPPVIEYGETVLIRLMPSSVEARFVPGGGVDGMILPRANGRRVAVAALLALRNSLGLEIRVPGVQQSLVELSGTPRTQKEILASARAVLEDTITVGLSHVSPAVADRLLTLSVSAQGANLPRVSLALRTIADEVKSILQREARADESRLFTSAARVYALMEAIGRGGETPRPEFVGVSRAQYVDVPEIELSGVGAYTWRTGSGYSGLTVLFWSNQSHEFLSWSEARPGTQQFDPRQRFYGEGPWDGSQSPRQVACCSLKLRNARRTVSGRISGSTKTSALVLAPTAPQALAFDSRLFGSWEVLQQYVRQRQPLGLCNPNPIDMVVVLEPSAFGSRFFDSVTQTFSWDVHDERDRVLTLSLPFREWSKVAINVLEGLKPPEEVRWRVLVRLALRDDLLTVEPISILRPNDQLAPVFQLSFDALPKQPTPNRAPSVVLPEEDEELPEEGVSNDDLVVPSGSYLYGVVTELNRRLQAIAETGCQSGLHGHREWFEKSRREMSDSGLTCLAGALKVLAESSSPAAGVLLRVRFLTHLHSQASVHVA